MLRSRAPYGLFSVLLPIRWQSTHLLCEILKRLSPILAFRQAGAHLKGGFFAAGARISLDRGLRGSILRPRKYTIAIIVFLVLTFKLLSFAESDFVYDAKGKRNPFIPLVTNEGRLIKLDKEEEKGSTDLAIDGIIYDKSGLSYAIINAAVVGVGDYVGEYRVLKVESDRVVFLKQDQIREVFITQEGASEKK